MFIVIVVGSATAVLLTSFRHVSGRNLFISTLSNCQSMPFSDVDTG